MAVIWWTARRSSNYVRGPFATPRAFHEVRLLAGPQADFHKWKETVLDGHREQQCGVWMVAVAHSTNEIPDGGLLNGTFRNTVVSLLPSCLRGIGKVDPVPRLGIQSDMR